LPEIGTASFTSPLAFLSSEIQHAEGTPTRSRTASPLRDGAKSGWPRTMSLVAVSTSSTTRYRTVVPKAPRRAIQPISRFEYGLTRGSGKSVSLPSRSRLTGPPSAPIVPLSSNGAPPVSRPAR